MQDRRAKERSDAVDPRDQHYIDIRRELFTTLRDPESKGSRSLIQDYQRVQPGLLTALRKVQASTNAQLDRCDQLHEIGLRSADWAGERKLAPTEPTTINVFVVRMGVLYDLTLTLDRHEYVKWLKSQESAIERSLVTFRKQLRSLYGELRAVSAARSQFLAPGKLESYNALLTNFSDKAQSSAADLNKLVDWLQASKESLGQMFADLENTFAEVLPSNDLVRTALANQGRKRRDAIENQFDNRMKIGLNKVENAALAYAFFTSEYASGPLVENAVARSRGVIMSAGRPIIEATLKSLERKGVGLDEGQTEELLKCVPRRTPLPSFAKAPPSSAPPGPTLAKPRSDSSTPRQLGNDARVSPAPPPAPEIVPLSPSKAMKIELERIYGQDRRITKLAKNLTPERFSEMRAQIVGIVGSAELADAVLGANSGLLTLNAPTFGDYIENLRVTTSLWKDGLTSGSLAPHEIASSAKLLALKENHKVVVEQRKLFDLLEQRGFDAQACYAVIACGFRFKATEFFVGNRRILRETVHLNLVRHVTNYPIMKRRLDGAFDHLSSVGALQMHNNAWSINPALTVTGPESEAALKLVRWCLANPPGTKFSIASNRKTSAVEPSPQELGGQTNAAEPIQESESGALDISADTAAAMPDVQSNDGEPTAPPANSERPLAQLNDKTGSGPTPLLREPAKDYVDDRTAKELLTMLRTIREHEQGSPDSVLADDQIVQLRNVGPRMPEGFVKHFIGELLANHELLQRAKAGQRADAVLDCLLEIARQSPTAVRTLMIRLTRPTPLENRIPAIILIDVLREIEAMQDLYESVPSMDDIATAMITYIRHEPDQSIREPALEAFYEAARQNVKIWDALDRMEDPIARTIVEGLIEGDEVPN